MAFTSGETLNISDPYNHPAFNRDFDDRSGYKTESILCMPITNKDGVFEARDEARLRAFTCATVPRGFVFDRGRP